MHAPAPWTCASCGHPIVNAEAGMVVGDYDQGWRTIHKNRYCDDDRATFWEELYRFVGPDGEEWFVNSCKPGYLFQPLDTPARIHLRALLVRPTYDQRRVRGPTFPQWLDLGAPGLDRTFADADVLRAVVSACRVARAERPAWDRLDEFWRHPEVQRTCDGRYGLLVGVYLAWQAYGFTYDTAEAPPKRRGQTRPAPKVAKRRQGWLALRFEVMKRDGYRCQLCGRTAQDGVTLEVDHKLARSKGGTNDPANLWTLCFPCNRGKGARDL